MVRSSALELVCLGLEELRLHLRLVLDETITRRAIPSGFQRSAAGRMHRAFCRDCVPGAPLREQSKCAHELHAL